MGVLVTNLGTPDAPTARAVRRFLAEFLADPRVVELPRPLWRLILHGFVLRVRPRRSAAAYRSVWAPDGSPLARIAERQAAALEGPLREAFGEALALALGMRYGRPSIAEAMERLRRAGITRLVVLPLYPQYSATTTASTFDAVSRVLQRWRRVPELRFVTGYHDDPGYLEALAASIREAWERHGQAQRLLLSFHGIPQRYARAGDPYLRQCQLTARLLAERLELPESRWGLSFQSRFGREPWAEPYTDHRLREWAQAGVESVQVVCPGFAADCLETLEEIAIQNREIFLGAGGRSFHYIPALNDRADHVRALADVVLRATGDWRSVDSRAVDSRAGAAESAAMSSALGATPHR